jgi:hypothetical protein
MRKLNFTLAEREGVEGISNELLSEHIRCTCLLHTVKWCTSGTYIMQLGEMEAQVGMFYLIL